MYELHIWHVIIGPLHTHTYNPYMYLYLVQS